MLWQLAYTELVFLPVHWPEFDQRAPGRGDRRVPAARAPLRGVEWLSAIRRSGCASLSALALVPVALAVVCSAAGASRSSSALAVALMALEWARLTRAALRPAQRPDRRRRGAAWSASARRCCSPPARPGQRWSAAGRRPLLAAGSRRAVGAPPLGPGSASSISACRPSRLIWLRGGAGARARRCCSGCSSWSGRPIPPPISPGAASAGRSWRRAISPSKTWSGLCGGVLGAALVGGLTAWLLGSGRLLQAAGLRRRCWRSSRRPAIWSKSAFKRRPASRTAARLIPGHGGVLDRRRRPAVRGPGAGAASA